MASKTQNKIFSNNTKYQISPKSLRDGTCMDKHFILFLLH